MSIYIHCCEALERACDDPDSAVTFNPKFREYGIKVLDGGSSYVEILFCPWSGQKLPGSLRDEWFNKLEAQGIDPGVDPIPLEFQSELWHTK
jgi:hypothetical protein